MEIKKVCVVGMGTMGSQIGLVAAIGGYQTAMVDASDNNVERGMATIRSFLEGRLRKGKLNENQTAAALSRITPGTDLSHALQDADLAIEAVNEDIGLKKEIFRIMDRLGRTEAILASNTSTLCIAEIAAATARPAQCIGTHFLIPAALTPLVEVVRGMDTSDDTHGTVIRFLAACGKQTVTVADSPGFVINRLYLPMINEAFFALEARSASADEIDKCCTLGLAFPLGPLAAADAFGLDILLACMQTFHRELGDKYRPAPLLVRLVKAGRLGRKSGRGVYDYD